MIIYFDFHIIILIKNAPGLPTYTNINYLLI